ncbi:uncharacterized protein LOC119089865 [Pollicipes pollicipes]|uniref:uncharacterized protein LOC119089865 n=1 Tax=Pollicipes pollicipes TaxID=41117 RepID=UPI00188545D5|nr:uncharacterized protein LOC119089865 [Pollicipes pollicipes]
MGLCTGCGYCPPLPAWSPPLEARPPIKGQQYYAASGQYGYGFPGYSTSSLENLTKLGHLVGLCGVATVGSMGNIYTISSCIVGDRLRKKGNIFIVNLSLAMLLVTLLVLPSIAIHMLAGADVSEQARRLHELVTQLCGCVSLFTLWAVALENYIRVCHRRAYRRLLSQTTVTVGLVLAWARTHAALLDFRESYVNLAQYCCCKMSVHFGKRPRSDLPRPLLVETRKSSMRVHLMAGYDMRPAGAESACGQGAVRHSLVTRSGSVSGARTIML